MSGFDLAELNVSRLRYPIDSPELAGFVANLDRINALAEASPGFVWRLSDDSGNATAIRPFGDDHIVNLSVWRDIESLRAYAYRSAHADILKRRKEWFEPPRSAGVVLWWVRAGRLPTLDEGSARLERLRRDGPTRHAFTFRTAFAPPEAPTAET